MSVKHIAQQQLSLSPSFFHASDKRGTAKLCTVKIER